VQRNYNTELEVENLLKPIAKLINTLENIIMNYIGDAFPKIMGKITNSNKGSLFAKNGYGFFELDCDYAIKLIYSEQKLKEKTATDLLSRLKPGGLPYHRLSDIIQLHLIVLRLTKKLKNHHSYLTKYSYAALDGKYCNDYLEMINGTKDDLVRVLEESLKEIHWKVSNNYSEVYGHQQKEFTLFIAGICVFPLTSSTKEMKKNSYRYVINSDTNTVFYYERRGLLGDAKGSSRIATDIQQYIFQNATLDHRKLKKYLTKALLADHEKTAIAITSRHQEHQRLMRERVEPLIRNNTELEIELTKTRVELQQTEEALKLIESQLDQAHEMNSVQTVSIFDTNKKIGELTAKIQSLELEAQRKTKFRSRK